MVNSRCIQNELVLYRCLDEGYDGAQVGLGAGDVEVVHALEVEPVVGGHSEGASDSQGGVSGYRPAAVDYVTAPCPPHT